MNKEDAFKVERGERAKYMAAGWDEPILLPLTYDGFECLIERVASHFELPLELFDDSVRGVFVGYIHHIDRAENSTTLESLGKVLTKSISNAMSWQYDQDLKAKRMEVIKQLQNRGSEGVQLKKISKAEAKRLKKAEKALSNGAAKAQ